MNIEEILGDEYLIRRIPLNNPDYIKPEGEICSYAFKPRKGSSEISVNIKKLTNYDDSVLDITKFCLAQIKTNEVRENDLVVIHTPELTNPSHASIQGEFSKKVCKNLARLSERIVKNDF